jgi:hypothetical protein
VRKNKKLACQLILGGGTSVEIARDTQQLLPLLFFRKRPD